MKSGLLSAIIFCSLVTGCGTGTQSSQKESADSTKTIHAKDSVVMSQGSVAKGIGRFQDVVLTHPLNTYMIAQAQAIYGAKCIACHKLTDEKLVGPGWQGITDRRTPEWIMNFITNTQVMLDKDLAAQSELVTCIVRMPDQDLSDEQARDMLEFMRKNDNKH